MFITINNVSAIEDYGDCSFEDYYSAKYTGDKEPKINIVKTKFIINTCQIVSISLSSNYIYDYTVIGSYHLEPITSHKFIDLKIQVRTIKMSNGDTFTITDDEFKKIIPLLSQEC